MGRACPTAGSRNDWADTAFASAFQAGREIDRSAEPGSLLLVGDPRLRGLPIRIFGIRETPRGERACITSRDISKASVPSSVSTPSSRPSALFLEALIGPGVTRQEASTVNQSLMG